MAHTAETTRPPLFRRHVHRPRLTRLLEESTAQSIVITAPAGYGKTTLAQEWLGDDDRAAWYRASSASADVAAFSVGIADAVAPIVPHAGDRLRQRLRVADAPERLVRPLAELLAEELHEWPEDAWLVVDDYHAVADSAPVEEFVDWLLTLAPVRLLVTTRRRPSWASARRILYGEITEIGRDELAMTNQEAALVLDGRPTEAVRRLVAQAQGWPALIGLAALSASSELPTERVSDALFRYFADEVFRQQPPDVQQFMLVASVPAGLNAHVAREVLGISDPEPLLQHLLDEGLLHTSGVYLRFHPLLHDFLRRRLQSSRPGTAAELALRAIEHARQLGRYEEAFGLAVAAGSLDVAAAIVAEKSPELLAHGHLETLENWLSLYPDSKQSHPLLMLAEADVLVRRGRCAEAAGVAFEVASRLSANDPHAPRAWNTAGDAFHLACDDARAIDCYLRARAAGRTDDDFRRACWGLLIAAADLGLPDLHAYVEDFERYASQDIDGQLRSAVARFVVARHDADASHLHVTFPSLIPLSKHSNDPLAKSSFLAIASVVSTYHSDYVVARQLATEALRVCADFRLSFATPFCLCARAHAEIGSRHFRAGARTLRELGTAHDDPTLAVEADIIRLRLSLSTHDLREHVISDITESDPRVPSMIHATLLGLGAIAAAARGDRDAVDELSDLTLTLSAALEPLYYARLARVIAGGVSRSPDRSRETIQVVREAFAAGIPDAVVLAYRACPGLLECVAQAPDVVRALRRIIISANDHPLAARAGITVPPTQPPHAGTSPKLTRRETEVLSLLSEGLSNREIAARLWITESTAKVHVRHIFEKLGARTRVQAVSRWHDSDPVSE